MSGLAPMLTDLSGLPEADQARERRIHRALERMVYGRTPAERVLWWDKAKMEIAQRSPKVVEALEAAKRLTSTDVRVS